MHASGEFEQVSILHGLRPPRIVGLQVEEITALVKCVQNDVEDLNRYGPRRRLLK